MYSFSSRDDTIVFDEPLYAHYLYCSGIKHPGFNKILSSYEKDGNKVVQEIILKNYSKPISFFKLMSHFTINLDLDFLKEVKNILLIRNPLDVILSYSEIINHPTLDDIGILSQYKMLNYFEQNNIPFIVVDSKDILEYPKKSLCNLCLSLDIRFDEKMLKWEKGPKYFDGIWSKYWYSSVHKTEGFSSNLSRKKKLEGNNIQLYEKALYYYNILKKYTL